MSRPDECRIRTFFGICALLHSFAHMCALFALILRSFARFALVLETNTCCLDGTMWPNKINARIGKIRSQAKEGRKVLLFSHLCIEQGGGRNKSSDG